MSSPLWTSLAARASIDLSADQLAALSRYLDLLIEANERMNLTRITDRAGAELLHVGDSLTVLPYLPAGAIRVADVGSGGGVPGIPLAIARPDAQFVLIDSTRKKTDFLRSAVAKLDLKNVKVYENRAETMAHVSSRSSNRESYDVALARAVATIDWLAEWCLPLVQVGGKMLAMKGPKVVEELPAAKTVIARAGGGHPILHLVELPGVDNHLIVEVQKLKPSDAKIPRDPTETRGKPIR